jgi:hypothetical protein
VQVLLLQVKLARRGFLAAGASEWWLSSIFAYVRKVGLGCVECGRTSARLSKTDSGEGSVTGRAVQQKRYVYRGRSWERFAVGRPDVEVVEVKSTMVRLWQVQMWLPIRVATESRYDVAQLEGGGPLDE